MPHTNALMMTTRWIVPNEQNLRSLVVKTPSISLEEVISYAELSTNSIKALLKTLPEKVKLEKLQRAVLIVNHSVLEIERLFPVEKEFENDQKCLLLIIDSIAMQVSKSARKFDSIRQEIRTEQHPTF